jgi:hypothetical protein
MAVFLPDPDGMAPDELIEHLGNEISQRMMNAEDELIRDIAVRAHRDIALRAVLATATLTAEASRALQDRIDQNRALAELQAHRAQSIRDLNFRAQEVAGDLRAAGLAQQVIDIAAREGGAAAAARLGMARNLPATTTLNANSSSAVAQLVIDLESRLELMYLRITRFPVDAYQRIISLTTPNVLLGVQTSRVAQAKAVQTFLRQGITGFVDKSGRNWRLGSYAEMATRTATNRAFNDAGTAQMQQVGVNLVTVVAGADGCAKCIQWAGKILSTDGSTGAAIMRHSTEDRSVAVQIAATLETARASGFQHPNCRCRCVAYLPGLSIPRGATTYDPEAERLRNRQRELERAIRAAKRDASTAGDPVSRKAAERDVKDAQARMRGFIKETGRTRQNAREQLHFADGK